MRTLIVAGIAAMLATPAAAVAPEAVVTTYANIAAAGYADSLASARGLRAAVGALVKAPSPETLETAKKAWVRARVPYQQTEVFRFGNPIVDDWEGKVNAWPLDEGLIDYVDADHGGNDENSYARVNVIANSTFTVSGREIDAREITPALLESLHEIDGIEANVATGYHAIEFLLWGQDLNGTGPGAGARPYTDFDAANCPSGNCDRRAAYLIAVTDLLISDLESMVAAWKPEGAARKAVTKNPREGVVAAFTGMGSLSYGEQAGERMKLGLMLHDPEEEHDCFSDNTHNSHYYDGVGVRNVYLGRYVRIDGSLVSGPSLSNLVVAAAPDVDRALRADLDATMAALGAIKATAEAGTAYDQMLGAENKAGEALIMAAINALVAQTRNIERAVEALSIPPIEFEGSDSLDNPSAVFQ